MQPRLRFATCNEVFENWKFHDACKAIRRAGYSGIEIAPFTLAVDPALLTADQRRQFRSIIQAEDLVFVGLHWLLAKPDGLHVTCDDDAVRTRSWQFVRDLIDLSADLGDGGVLVFGSPKQRSATGGVSPKDATARFVDGLCGVSSQAAERGVTLLVEALPANQSNIVNSLEEAAQIVKQIGSPAVRTMFDTHNAVDETEPHDVLVERYFDLIRHVHVNEMDGRHPG
ncbi:MAG: sugar phosphate isomerase/epimerase family protein, partial [Bryobacteraceae bacterium]